MVQWKKNFEKNNPGILYLNHMQITDDHIAYAYVDLRNAPDVRTGIYIYALTNQGENWSQPVAHLQSWDDVKHWKQGMKRNNSQDLHCDLCGQPTDTNHFPDEFTVLCEHCATNSGIKGGRTAAEYITQKATGGAK